MTEAPPASLIDEILQLDEYIETQTRRLDEFLKPHRESLEAKKHALQNFLNQTGGKNFKSEKGTAYLSTTTSYSIDGDRTQFLDWVLDKWDERGDMLKIGAPYVDPVRAYMDANNGQLPPGISLSKYSRLNVNRS